MVFFLPCDHGLNFDISLCENSINHSIKDKNSWVLLLVLFLVSLEMSLLGVLQWGLRFKRAEFKRIAGLRDVKIA